ncbi:MAG: GTPase HflX [Polyangiales bacterium]
MKELERLDRRRVPFDVLSTPELTRALCSFSHASGRQLGVLIDRAGVVQHVVVGDARQLFLPDLGRMRAAHGRLRGLRLVHTHLHHEPLTRDDLVDLTLLRLDLVAALCLGPKGNAQQVYYAHNVALAPGEQQEPYRSYGPIPWGQVALNPQTLIQALEAEFARVARTHTVRGKDGRAILVQVVAKGGVLEAEARMHELGELARTAGVGVADRIVQQRERPHPKYVLGRGRLEQVVIRAMQLDAEVLIFDHNLSPTQAAAIAAMTDLKVLDRTQLILDIFAQRAQSLDGKLQVELAQMRYLLPRLGSRDDALSRLTGGIGGRGPGETKLEIGKRRARERITRLERQLGRMARQRVQRRVRRRRREVPVVAIVGYTNAGKSTLLNQLTESHSLAEDKLFATLDTRSKRLRFPEEREIVITDTVGFIRALPQDLFAAFRATFEEAQDADLLLEVVDAADPALGEQRQSTAQLLRELDLDRMPRLLVYNKADRLTPAERTALAAEDEGIVLSALDRASFAPLLRALERRLFVEVGGGGQAGSELSDEAESD